MTSESSLQDGEVSQPDKEKDATPYKPPPRPVPSMDPKLVVQARTPPPFHAAAPTPSSQDLFKIAPISALKLLSSGIEALVRITGDVPPTPPPANPTYPNMRGMQREKVELVRSHSEKNLARLQEQADAQQKAQEQQGGFFNNAQPPKTSSAAIQQPIDGVHLKPTPSPLVAPTPSAAATPVPYMVIGADSQPLNLQHSAITRKFFSKAPPPISVEEYLLRIHRFCPMSTAVYLATSFYIFRLAVEERAIPVTRRNCHRLLLAGLRVAMKALEDLSYPHAKIARVGGVSEAELARLEISFCFLAGFELVVGEETLRGHWEELKLRKGQGGGDGDGDGDGAGGGLLGVGTVPTLKLDHRRKKNFEFAGPE